MFFVGIDIGKRNHEACVINEHGQIIGKSLSLPNTQIGGQKLLHYLHKLDPDLSSTMVAMEATGHYWLALYSFLRKQGLTVHVINPIQSDALRNLYIRQTKNDSKDAFIIAEVLRFGRYTSTALADEKIIALRQLSRFRFSLIDSISDLKRKAISLLDQLFPEYEHLFSDLFGKTSSELLMEYTTPEEIVALDTQALAAFLGKHSRNRFGLAKAEELKTAASTSFGIDFALDAFRLQMKVILKQIQVGEEQLELLDEQITRLLGDIDQNLVTIPGVGSVLAAAILGEIGDISRFDTGAKLVAFAGIDPTVRQSGEFCSTHNRMSKRGSPYLRRALWLAANSAKLHNPIMQQFYKQKRAQGKHHMTAIGAVCRKLTYVIHAVLRDQKPYQPKA